MIYKRHVNRHPRHADIAVYPSYWRTLDGLFKSNGCFSLIELDEVFDRKSIKRDGAARQLQSAEGSRMRPFYIIVQTQYGK